MKRTHDVIASTKSRHRRSSGRARLSVETLECRQLLDGGGVPPGFSLAQANWFYQNVFLPPASVAPQWNGNVATGNAGSLGPDYLAAIVARINAYRWMAGIPGGVSLDSSENAADQQDALMTAANNQLSHNPPSTWVYYSPAGAQAASHSDLALGASGTSAIDLYMTDPGGTNSFVGHRRWILDPPTQTMGVGDIPGRSNSLWVIQTQSTPVPDVSTVAWPPAGFVPASLIPDRWSVQAPYGSDFSNATVTVTENGVPEQVEIQSNSGLNYGGQAIVWDLPDATAPEPGQQTVYNVQITNAVINGQAQSFSYTTTAFDPSTTTYLMPVPAQVGFLQTSAQVNRLDGTVTIDVARSMNADQQVSVNYATADGTATAGVNYVASSGVLTFGPGQFYGQIVVPILPGSSGGTFSIALRSPTNASIGPISQFRVTITANPPPIEFSAPALDPASDSGTRGDSITDDTTPFLSGWADATETIRLLDGALVIGTATSDAQGYYDVSVQKALTPGNYELTVYATDATGSTAASYPVYVTIVAPPAAPSAPALLPADDSGTQGDGITDYATPRLTGFAIANRAVQLVDSSGNVLATTTASSSGSYIVRVPGALTAGTFQYRVDVIDWYGDTSVPSNPVSLTIVSAPPTPSAPTLWPADSNGRPGGETTNLASPHLTGTVFVSGTVALLTAKGVVINTTQTAPNIPYRVQVPGPLGAGSYSYKVVIIDKYGDISNPSPLGTITVASIPPVIVASVRDVVNRKQLVTQVLITFSGPVDASEARRIGTYHLASPGKGGSFTTKNAGWITLASASYNPANHAITLIPRKAFSLNKPVQLAVLASGPYGLQDTYGRYINGGKNIVVML
jgi:hypothetical protein